jgi:para-aminobenzoate synthetase component 1
LAILSLGRTVPNLAVFDLDPASRQGRTVVTWGDYPPIQDSSFTRPAREAIQDLPKGGLLAGYLGYEAGASCERMPLPVHAPRLPLVHLRPTDGHLVHHASTGQWTVHGTAQFQRDARSILRDVQSAPTVAKLPAPLPLEGPRDGFLRGVRAALHHIRDGEIYQVNLSWEATSPPLKAPLQTWLQLRHHNPARRGAFLQLTRETAILSNSPETYLDVFWREGERMARSVPIKGTVRAAEGAAGRRHLERSPKERAELTMIVDLVRNDLGRVAGWGDVTTHPRTLTVCGDLIHAEQVVEARLRAGADALDAVDASFPPGSVTGAPKVRAMELIRALEPVPRGIYTGAIGFFAASGEARFNVAIRTVTCTRSASTFHLGAGIVADSIPDAEWEETRAKGDRIHAVLSAAAAPGGAP